MILRVTG